jgi:Zn finger protein HypA/HybF involved in hydrogenase expression
MSILDEIKKKTIYDNTVLLSDIEQTLARCTCENCKWLNTQNNRIYFPCKNDRSFTVHVFHKGIADFGCNQWESK